MNFRRFKNLSKRRKLMLRMYVFLSCITIFLSACSFKPVYKKNSYFNNDLNSIKILPINSIPGAELYHAFYRLMPLTQPAKYLLSVNFTIASRPQIIEKNSNVIMTSIMQHVTYTLNNIENSSILTSGSFYLSSSVQNSTLLPYSSYVEADSSTKILSVAAARKIRDRLILYFQTQKTLTNKINKNNNAIDNAYKLLEENDETTYMQNNISIQHKLNNNI